MATPLEYPERVSYEWFLREYEGSYAEWVDGVIHPMNPPGTKHQNIVIFLGALLKAACEERHLGSVFVAPTQMKIGSSGREPDVLVIRHDGAAQITATHVEGPADLVVEVVNPDSRRRDRVEKLAEYEVRGVREYWLIDPVRKTFDVFRRTDQDRFERVDLGVPPRVTTEV